MMWEAPSHTADDDVLVDYLAEARELFESIDPGSAPEQDPLEVSASFEDLRCFLMPDEVRAHE